MREATSSEALAPRHDRLGSISHFAKRSGKAVARALRKLRRDLVRNLDRETVARLYLKGIGIEIGALHEPLRVPKSVVVRYVDRMSTPDLRRHYPELASVNLVNVHIIDDGERLATVSNESQDFVIANQVLEHCANPLFALENMLRVLKVGGILYLSLPDKRYSFDVDRPVTPIAHVLRDYREGPEWSKRQHFEEWVRCVEHLSGAAFTERVEALMRIDYSIHYHVWTQLEMLELLGAAAGLVGHFEIELFLRTDYDVEHLIILRKTAPRG